MRKCRIFIADMKCNTSEFLEQVEKLGEDVSAQHLPGLYAANPDAVSVYEYESPSAEFDMKIGRGVLFDNDWTAQDTMSLVQVFNEETQTWE